MEETFLEPKLSLEKKIRVRLGSVLVIIRGYQLTYYWKINNDEKSGVLSMFAVVV